jgi:hypothetical protein
MSKTTERSGSILSMNVREQSFSIQMDDSLYINLNLYADTAVFWDVAAAAAGKQCAYFKFFIQGKVVKHFESLADERREVLKGCVDCRPRRYQDSRLAAYNGKKVLVQPCGDGLMVRNLHGGYICLAACKGGNA